MADQKRNDPLDERLRATFAAERDDMERRRIAGAGRRVAASSPNWLPLAAAAAVIAVLAIGVAIMGNRAGDDEAVDVDVAAQPTEEPDTPPDTDPVATPTVSPTAGTAAPTPAGPEATPTVSPEARPPAANECGEPVSAGVHFVWNVAVDDPDGGLVAHTAAGVDEPVTRVLPYNAVVDATGGCARTADGAAWYELSARNDDRDWVNAAFLRLAEQACFGIDEEPFFHTLEAGETLGHLAQLYNVTLDDIIDSNPELDAEILMVGQLVRIPSAAANVEDGNGWAVFDERGAFASLDAATYLTAPSAVLTRGACDGGGASGGGCGSADDRACVATGDTDLDSLPCAPRIPRPVAAPLSAGSSDSSADHVHDMTAESNDECTRLVVTFGEGANEEELVAGSLPPIMVDQGPGHVSVLPDDWAIESAFDDPMRIDYLDGTGIGLLTVSFGFEFSVEFMHPDHEPHVRFFEDPARVVIDLFATDASSASTDAPFGNRFFLRRPLQPELDGPGVPADQPIVVSGFGRPFEAAGLYRIWSVPADVDVDAFPADPGEPLYEDFFPTSGWAEAWGQFEVTLPELAPGSYIAVFGELPPTDEIGFYGVGQLFHVYDPDAPPEVPYPEAVLLPDVQLDPEF